MEPHEIKPDTKLCTIIGYNAQTGTIRRIFNKILKHNGLNATAIALNLNDDNFDFTMQNVAQSKIERMIVEREFGAKVPKYCDELDAGCSSLGYADFIEIKEQKLYGFNLEDEAKAWLGEVAALDDTMVQAAKMMLLANRWFGVQKEKDMIPLVMGG